VYVNAVGRPIRSTRADLPGQEGKALDVEIYSRCDFVVRLYLGVPSSSARSLPPRGAVSRANFSVPFAPGVLRAVALRAVRRCGSRFAHCSRIPREFA